MKTTKIFNKLSKTFKKEESHLFHRGINTWNELKALKNSDISDLVRQGCGSNRNFRCLRCIASFICDLDIQQDEAALLMHSGVPSVEALANSYPEEIYTKITRLEIILGTKRSPSASLEKLSEWIEKAKEKS